MGPAAFDAAEAGVIPLVDALAVLKVLFEVFAFGAALLARAHGFVAFDKGAVLRAELSAAVLADVLGRVRTAGEYSTNLTRRGRHL